MPPKITVHPRSANKMFSTVLEFGRFYSLVQLMVEDGGPPITFGHKDFGLVRYKTNQISALWGGITLGAVKQQLGRWTREGVLMETKPKGDKCALYIKNLDYFVEQLPQKFEGHGA